MATSVTMPKLGLTMQEGKIIEWKKKEGDEVKKGEVLLVIETEKVSYEVEAPESGVLGKIMAKADDVVPVGTVLAYILKPGETLSAIPEAAAAAPPEPAKAAAKAELAAVAAVPAPAAAPADIRISPLARRIADENKIDISGIKGTGPEGRIIKEDVLRAIEERKAAPAPAAAAPAKVEVFAEDKVVPFSTMQKTIARRMSEAFGEVPHFYMGMEMDVSGLKQARERLAPVVEKKIGIRLTYTDLLVKLVAKVLEDYPRLNSTYTENGIKLLGHINIGIAAAVEAGLIVPVIRDANKMSLTEICAKRAEIVQKTRERKVSLEEITGSTFTITNVGVWGVYSFAILNPPEAAILSVGSMDDRPWVKDGQVVVRPAMRFHISIDHRVLYGEDAGNFLNGLKGYIDDPLTMLL